MIDESRVNRLIGGEVGGGLPLPLAFSAVAEELLDNGVASFTDLCMVIEKSLAFKRNRVLSTAWRTWEDFSRDVLEQMKAQQVIEGTGESYWISRWFIPGERQVVIPGPDIGFTTWDKKTREKKDRDSALLLDLRALIVKYEDADGEVVTLLREADYRLDLLVTSEADRLKREITQPKPRRSRKHQRSGMSEYFREFWATAPMGERFTVMEVLRKWSAEHPEQPPAGTHDVGGSMRKIAREMAMQGLIEEHIVDGTDSIGRPAVRKYYSRKPE